MCQFIHKAKLFGMLILFSMLSSIIVAEDSKFLTISDGWVRLTPPVVENTAGYFQLTNKTKASLTIVAVESSVAKHAALHDMVNDNGAMSMQHIPELTIKSGETVKFMPGGKHMMLMGLIKPLKDAQMIDVSFAYKSGLKQSLQLPVKRQVMKMQHKH